MPVLIKFSVLAPEFGLEMTEEMVVVPLALEVSNWRLAPETKPVVAVLDARPARSEVTSLPANSPEPPTFSPRVVPLIAVILAGVQEAVVPPNSELGLPNCKVPAPTVTAPVKVFAPESVTCPAPLL